MDGEFKWLCNPTKKDFVFQYDSRIYEVPRMSKRLFPADVTEHGLKRSFYLTDPEFDNEGNVVKTGNDVVKMCYTEEANTMSGIKFQEPIIVEASRDSVDDAQSLSVDPTKPLNKKRGRPPYASQQNAESAE